MGRVKLEIGMEFRDNGCEEIWRVIEPNGSGGFSVLLIDSRERPTISSASAIEDGIELVDDFEFWVSKVRKEHGCKDDD